MIIIIMHVQFTFANSFTPKIDDSESCKSSSNYEIIITSYQSCAYYMRKAYLRLM